MEVVKSEKRVKVTITATDRVGREESITLMLEMSTAKRLINTRTSLREELNELEYDAEQRALAPVYHPGHLSKSQYRRLRDFDRLIFHKFYNYTLSATVK